MVYLKIIVLFFGSIALGIVPLPDTSLTVQFLIWTFFLAVLLALHRQRLGSRQTLAVIKTVGITFIVWTISAAALSRWLSGSEGYWYWLGVNGPLHALRFSNAVVFAYILIASVAPNELYSARLVPRKWKIFLLVFRAFVAKFHDLLSDALDQLHVLGLPTLGNLIKSCFLTRERYPTHEAYSFTRSKRWRISSIILIDLFTYHIERVIIVEIPEMASSVDSLFAQEDRTNG